ncbi:46 kDa FK506-binding nuclear protein-like [Diadema antillarum]|uniref:46 kDa FK506-binding nuclear protein-like n=1 Tax=Diadema antillarum TaxID=105358 RepID=UPI003A8C4D88
MFWGLTIEPGKHYSQTVEQSFHVSMAALDTREKSGITQLLVRHEKAEFLLCTLIYGDKHPFPCFQQQLNLNLSEGSEISFYTEGKGTIHLTGYLVTDNPVDFSQGLLEQAESLLMDEEEEEEEEDDEEDDETDSEEESSSSADVSLLQMIENAGDEDDDDSDGEEWTPDKAKKSKEKSAKKKKRKSQLEPVADEATFSTVKKKRKAAVEAQALSKNELAEADGDEDDEENDGDFIPAAADGDDDDDDDSNEDGDDDDDGDDSEEDEEEDKPKSTKENKSQIKREAGSGQDAGVSTNGQKSEGKGGQPLKNAKGDNKENIQAQKKEKAVKRQPEAQKTKVKLQSGTSIEDIKLGEGKVAKPGRKVFVYYKGVFANNHKEFDSKLTGKPFMFILGRGEVIKGWDEGVRGMKVGGKRRLTVPPSQGYGRERTGPIPPNSTLVFEVELKQVR